MELKVFSGNSNLEFAKNVCWHINPDMSLRGVDIRRFADGEIRIQFEENLRGRDVFLIQSTNSPHENLFELFLMIDAAKRASAGRVTAVIPYFGYARQERKDRPRVAVAAKAIANMLMALGTDRILTMDLHVGSIEGFFDKTLVDQLYAISVFTDFFRSHFESDLKKERLVIASPDIGGVARARAYGRRLGVPLVIVDKRREEGNKAQVMNVIGDVSGKTVLIIDDIVDTAGTLCGAAKAFLENGAIEIYAVATHGLFSGDALTKIDNSNLTKIFVTDTLERSRNFDVQNSGPIYKRFYLAELVKKEKIAVLSVAPLFAEAIKRIHSNEGSISTLFKRERAI